MLEPHIKTLVLVSSLAVAGFAVLLLTSCGVEDKSSKFDEWYEQVINEPYDPLNGSKY